MYAQANLKRITRNVVSQSTAASQIFETIYQWDSSENQ